MSGAGTNIGKLLEHQQHLQEAKGGSPYKVVFIFSDRSDGISAGEKLALEYGIPYSSYDIRAFHTLRSLRRALDTDEGLGARKEYDLVASKLVEAFGIDMIALGGYMSYLTLERCVNVHPADLSICSPDGSRKYVGDNAVWDAIVGGEKVLRASTLLTDQGIDTGPLLMVSNPIPVTLPEPVERLMNDHEGFKRTVAQHQARLKEEGDWKIFPRTMELIAEGRFALDSRDRVYVDGQPVPSGYRE
jgi:folate-dependent phosphoribosylglycinamide formyltransferase PurN